MCEIWKDIRGYEGFYLVSNHGNIKSIKRNIILKSSNNKKGYLQVILGYKGKTKAFRVHRLVAENFIENVDKKSQVNHIDGNKHNNRVDNLEWCTNSENQKHAFKYNLQNNKGILNPNCKKINQYSLSGVLLKTWNGFYEIEKELNYSRSSIWRCCINKYSSSHGYIWKYA